MGFSKDVYESAEQILRGRRRNAEESANQRKEKLFLEFPRMKEIENSLATTAISAAKAVIGGKNAKEQLQNLHEKNRLLQLEYAELLKEAGYGSTYLEPQYFCNQCHDSGYLDGKTCDCLKQLLREEAYKRLNALAPLSLSTFDSFDLDFYPERSDDGERSPKNMMQDIFFNCKRYAKEFSLASPNLLMQGNTGLGKTHLSLAIANEVIQRGFGVIYSSANGIIGKLENEHFGREESGGTDTLLQNCDLLILDDLGTEFKSSFSISAVYNLVNNRLLLQKPTIINTNLGMNELQERYSDRFASRISGNYVRLPFLGRDNRIQRLFKNNSLTGR